MDLTFTYDPLTKLYTLLHQITDQIWENVKRRWLKKKGIVFVVTHNNVINQIIAVLYGVQYEKVDIVFPHAEPLLLKIGKNGRVYYCKRIKL